jgi:hypothetical protein
LAPTEFLQVSRALGITFEFWENLALRLLKDPNFHDEEIWDAITEGPGGLDIVDFIEKENFYLTMTTVLKKEEWCFYAESVQEGFLPYNENRDYTDILYPVRRFCNPTYRFVNDQTDFMVFDDIFDLELQAGFGLSECTFHEPKEFKGSHVVDEVLSIDSCRGITTRRLPAQVRMVHHLKWIAEYANACERCHESADSTIRDFAWRDLSAYHRPYYHPAFFVYPGRQIQDRAAQNVYLYSSFEQQPPSYRVYEPRPSKGEFFVHLIEQHYLVLNDPAIGIPVEGQEATTSSFEDEYLTFLMDEDLIVLSDDASES